VDTGRTTTSTLKRKLQADGGAVVKKTDEDSPSLYAEEHDECDYANLSLGRILPVYFAKCRR
jgi:hypothetical protein